MIHFELHNQQNPELFTFKVKLDPELQTIVKDYLIVRFDTITGGKGWETQVLPGGWSSWNGGGCSRWNVIVMDSNRNVIFTREYNSLYDGGELDKFFSFYCKKNKNTKGIVIGAHDGEWGHWTQPVLDKDTECIIIEGSKPQFETLEKNYKSRSNCTLINEIVTTNGEDVEWHTGGDGYTDSVVKQINQRFLDDDEITTELRKSISINKLIEEYKYQDYDWLHTDIEGYDAELIMSLKYLPKFIIFENEHSKFIGTYEPCINHLKNLNYEIIEYGIDTLAVKQ